MASSSPHRPRVAFPPLRARRSTQAQYTLPRATPRLPAAKGRTFRRAPEVRRTPSVPDAVGYACQAPSGEVRRWPTPAQLGGRGGTRRCRDRATIARPLGPAAIKQPGVVETEGSEHPPNSCRPHTVQPVVKHDLYAVPDAVRPIASANWSADGIMNRSL